MSKFGGSNNKKRCSWNIFRLYVRYRLYAFVLLYGNHSDA